MLHYTHEEQDSCLSPGQSLTSSLRRSTILLVLMDGLDSPRDCFGQLLLILQVLYHLLNCEGIEDHAYDTTSHRLIDFLDFNIEVLTKEVLLGCQVTLLLNTFHSDGGSPHRHANRLLRLGLSTA